MGEALAGSFLPEVRNDILYVKCKAWGSLSVVGALPNDAGTTQARLSSLLQDFGAFTVCSARLVA